MGGSYDAINDRSDLSGDTTGYAWVKKALPSAPTGTDQAIYVMRYWFDGSQAYDTNISWDTSFHLGLNFGPVAPIKNSTTFGSAAHHTAYANFLGIGQYADTYADDLNGASAGVDAVTDPGVSDKYSSLTRSVGGVGLSQRFTDGQGAGLSGISSLPLVTPTLYPLTIPATEISGLARTFVWRVRRGSASNEQVLLEVWVNTQSKDLDAFDLETDLDPDNPRTFFPVGDAGDAWPSGVEINGVSETGGNWMPTSGNMGFPNYFMAQYPMDAGSLIIDYVGVRYDSFFA
jgi:hypothetical protein